MRSLTGNDEVVVPHEGKTAEDCKYQEVLLSTTLVLFAPQLGAFSISVP